MQHHIARVGDKVKEAIGPEMFVFAYDSGGNLHCEWTDEAGARQEKTCDPSVLTMVVAREEQIIKAHDPA